MALELRLVVKPLEVQAVTPAAVELLQDKVVASLLRLKNASAFTGGLRLSASTMAPKVTSRVFFISNSFVKSRDLSNSKKHAPALFFHRCSHFSIRFCRRDTPI